MDFRLLGPLEVVDDDGREIAITSGRQRALLALLLLRANELVSSDVLVGELWGEAPPPTAHNMLHNQVSALRRALGANGRLETRAGGYRLKLREGERDVDRFEALVARGRESMGDDPQGAAEAFGEALGLWRGRALADLAYESFAQTEVGRLEERRLAAFEGRMEAELAVGRHADVIAELEAAVAEHPYRERLRAQLMLALYRCERQADALQAYRDARSKLVKELGIEPGERLRELERAILAQDPALAAPQLEPFDMPPELDSGTPLADREAELDWLREHWRRAHGGAGRMVLVAGAAGMGKTRLAAELAAEVRRDRAVVHFVSGAGPSRPAREVLAGMHGARRPTLLVLDNVDRADDELRVALSGLVDGLAAIPVLVVATAVDGSGVPAVGGDATLRLTPLGRDGMRAVGRLYVGPRDDVEIPVERLAEASGGIPRRVHRAAAEWARQKAAQRLGVTARRAASERAGLRETEDDLAGDVVELEAVRERAGLLAEERSVVACPFKGLASFDVEDADIFFGRERLVAELVARLAGAPVLGIVGPSGSGKSSALRAGLLAALAAGVLPRSEDWGRALLRPGEHPLRALEAATSSAAKCTRLVLAVDQFEEVFTACRDESERGAFADALVATAEDPRYRAVLVAVRADFYGHCAAYPEFSRLLGANHVLVGPMRRDELRRAIELPARRAGLHVEAGLADVLVADVEGQPGALPLLSTALLELWQHRDGRQLRLGAYDQAGGVRRAVGRLAERAYARLDPERREIARQILLRLAGEGEPEAVVRRRVALGELGGQHDHRVGEVLAVLADDRLVTIGESRVEVAHEALLREWPRLRSWLEEDAEGRRLHQHLRAAAQGWEASGHDASELYRGARLASALDWSAAHEAELNERERAFLNESRAASERAQRRLRAGLVGVAALLVLAAIAGLIALDQRGKAQDEAVAADAQRLGALALLEDDLDRALLLARQSVALNDTAQTRGNLLAALLKIPAAIGVIRADSGRILATALSPDGRTLAVGNSPGRVLLFDTRTRQRVAVLRPTPSDAEIFELAYDPDGSRLAIVHLTESGAARGGVPPIMVTVVDLRTRQKSLEFRLPGNQPVSGVKFSADGRTISIVTFEYPDGAAIFRRLDTSTGRRVLGPTRINRRGWSPLLITNDERRMVVVGDGEITLRDATTLSVLRRFPGIGPSASLTSLKNQAITGSSSYALSSDNHTLSFGTESGSLRLLDLRTGETRTAAGAHEAGVRDANFSPDGRQLVTTGEDGVVIVWNVRTAAAAETLRGHAGPVFSPQVTRNGATLFTASEDGTVFVWDLSGRRRLGRPFRIGAGPTSETVLSSDGRLLATSRLDGGAISIVETDTLERRKPIRFAGTGSALSIEFAPRSHRLVFGGRNGILTVVDIDSRRVVGRLPGDDEDIFSLGISAAGGLLATTHGDNGVRVWSLPEKRQVGAPLRFGSAAVLAAEPSPDGRWLAIALLERSGRRSGSYRLEVWDARTRQVVHRVRLQEIAATAFSPDASLLAVAGNRDQARIWSTETWKPVTRSFTGHTAAITGLAISPDSRTLASGSFDGTVRLWDIDTEQAVGAPLPGLPNRSVQPVFAPDGAYLFAAHETGAAHRWDIRPEALVRQACRVAGRRLTRVEWAEFLPTRDYDPAC